MMIKQGTLAADVRASAAQALKTIKAYADAKKVLVTVENRHDPSGYVSSTVQPADPPKKGPPEHTWEDEVRLIKSAGVRVNPDVASFPDNGIFSQLLRL